MEKLILLDGHAIIHRAFHAIQPLTTASGEPVNAVFGFGSMLFNCLEIEKPTYLAATFDEKGPTKRSEVDDTYKANRPAAPDALISQFGRCRELCTAFNIPIFAQSGYEADDLIGTIATKMAEEQGVHTIIVSGDRDLLQLVTPSVSVHDLTGGYRKSVNWTPAVVQERYGFAPKYIPDYKGLAGDASDNIAGVPGVGPKTATELIQKYGQLEEIWRHLAELKSDSLRVKLAEHYETALHCRQMATVMREVPLEWRIENTRLHDFDAEPVIKLFTELEFRTLQARAERLFPEQFHACRNPSAAAQQSLF
jgi:DNA polymerase-1